MFDCKLCQQLNANNNNNCVDAQIQCGFANLDELEAHLASDHFNCLPYECEQCQFAKFPTEFAVMKHNEHNHGNKHYMFRCRITPFIQNKRLKIRDLLLAWTAGHNAKVSGEQIIVRSDAQAQSSFGQQHSKPPKLKPETNSSPSICSSSTSNIDGVGLTKNHDSTQQSGKQTIDIKSEITEEDVVTGHQEYQQPSEHMFDEEQEQQFNNVDKLKNFKENADVDEESDEDAIAMDYGDANVVNTPTSLLLEQIEAATGININKNWNEKTSTTSFGGTMEIREGRELSATFLSTLAGGETHHDEGDENQNNGDYAECVKDLLLPKEETNLHANIQSASTNASGMNTISNDRYSLRQKSRHFPSFLPNKQRSKNMQRQGKNVNALVQFKGGYKQPVARIKCRKCGEMVNCSGGCLMHHVNTRHMRFPLFQCKQCNMDFYEVSNTRIHKHMRIHHKGDTSNLVSNYLKYTALLHDARDDCFGNRLERQKAILQGQLRFVQLQRKYGNDQNADNTNNSQFSSLMPILAPNKSAEQTCAAVRAILQKTNEVVQQQQQQYNNEEDIGEANGHYEANDGTMGMGLDEMKQFGEEGDEQAEYDVGNFTSLYPSTSDRKPPSMANNQQNWNVAGVTATEVGPHNSKTGNTNNNTIRKEQQLKKIQRNANSFMENGGNDNNCNNDSVDQKQFQRQQMQHPCDDKVPCKACGEMVFNKMMNRLNHVNVRHLHLPLHQCRICRKPFTSYSRSACYSHVQFAHRLDLESGQFSPNIDEHIIYMKEHYEKQLVEASYGYFPFGVL